MNRRRKCDKNMLKLLEMPKNGGKKRSHAYFKLCFSNFARIYFLSHQEKNLNPLAEVNTSHRARNIICISDERHLLTPANFSWNLYMPHSSLKRYEVKTLLVGSENGLRHKQRWERQTFSLPKCIYWYSKGDFRLAERGQEEVPW